ncbi:nonsense-mediated mRNA decay factor SMG7-like isoform X2 [Littorina saxatilis]|uniref:Protein SMG7 n=1 Tax=Littorina saxatilis TaxID=31220 RepID=A0AAN9AXB9_9CAEN
MVKMSSAAQTLRQAESLKATLVENGKTAADSGKGPLDGGKTISEGGKGVSDVWVTRQKLEDVYKHLLLMDLEYALDKKVEQDLWNHAFKNQITLLQAQAKDKHNPKKAEVQANLNLFLETASGFYLQFLQLICSTFKLDLPFRRKSSAFGVMKEKAQLRAKITPPKKSSCLYICQYCLVHLGDIARYRQQGEQAQTYYRHAVNLSPQNGQPYNQLAILEVNRNNKLSSVFYYVRSLAVRHPFPVAATNLEKFYTKLIKDTSEFKGKMAQNEFVNAFLQFQALLHLAADFNRASYLCSRILSCLPTHLVSQTFSASVLVQCVAITIFTLNHVRHVPSGGEATSTTSSPKGSLEGGGGEQGGDKWIRLTSPSSTAHQVEVLLSSDEQKSLDIILGFTASVLELLVQHTPQLPAKSRESPTLPAIQVLLDWLRHSPDVITLQPFANSNIWGHLAKLLNSVQQFQEGKPTPDLSKYEEVPLPEDTELRCFQPIEKAHSKYSFSRIPVDGFPRGVEELVRCMRLVNQGKAITEEFPELKMTAIQQNDPPHINFSGPLVMKSIDSSSTSQERRAKQNVAMQAIIKHGQGNQSDTGKGKQDGSSPELGGSPKYLLGTVTSEPQFMKHGGGGSGNRLQTSPQLSPRLSRRGQSPQARDTSPMQGFTSPRVASPRPGGGRVTSLLPATQQQQSPPQGQARKQQQQSAMNKGAQQKPPGLQGSQPQTQPALSSQQPVMSAQQPFSAQQQQQQMTAHPPQQQQMSPQQQQQHGLAQQQMSMPQQQQQSPIAVQNFHAGKVRFQAPVGPTSPPIRGHGAPQHVYPSNAPFPEQGHAGQGHMAQGHGQMPQGHGFQGQGVMQGHQQEGQQVGGVPQYSPYQINFPSMGGDRFQVPGIRGAGSQGMVHPQMDTHRMQQPFPAVQGVVTSHQASGLAQNPAPNAGSRHPSPNMPLNQERLAALRLASQIAHAQAQQQGGGGEVVIPSHPSHPSQQQEQQQPQPLHHPMTRAPIQRPPIVNQSPASRGGTGISPAPNSPVAYPASQPFHPGMGMPQRPTGDIPMHTFSASRPHPQGPRPHMQGPVPPRGHEMGMGPGPHSRISAPPIPMPGGHHGQGGAGFSALMTGLFHEEGGGGSRSDGVRGFQALSPLTIQPPKSSPPDTRICSSFQGHAEGTPKPEKQGGMLVEKREPEPVILRVAMPVGQPGGEYSLFASSSPWSMPLNTGPDTKSMASSPFSSQDSSMRNSPVVGSDPQTAGPYDNAARHKGPQGEGWVGQGQGYEEQKGRGPSQGQHAGNMPVMWTEAPANAMTPLERLLEQQRMQRQTDPH